jgi:hypothetical protein
MTSTEVYDRLGLDSRNARDKKVASRVMKAVGFVARRGRRWAVWEKLKNLESNAQERAGPAVGSPPLSHYHIILLVSLSLLSPTGPGNRPLEPLGVVRGC